MTDAITRHIIVLAPDGTEGPSRAAFRLRASGGFGAETECIVAR